MDCDRDTQRTLQKGARCGELEGKGEAARSRSKPKPVCSGLLEPHPSSSASCRIGRWTGRVQTLRAWWSALATNHHPMALAATVGGGSGCQSRDTNFRTYIVTLVRVERRVSEVVVRMSSHGDVSRDTKCIKFRARLPYTVLKCTKVPG